MVIPLSLSEYFCFIAVGLTLLLVVLHAQLQDALARATRAEAAVTELSQPSPAPRTDVTLPADDTLHARLIGLQGRFRHVVIIVDRSASMKAGGRWVEVRTIIDTWIRHLKFDKAALIVFNDTVNVFPSEGGYLDFASPTNALFAREEMLAYLRGIEPAGNTNTLSALRRAYAYQDVDTILIFSDGFPDRGRNRFDREMANAIYALCRSHGREIPINVIGVGRYLDRRLGEFLTTVARLTAGAFIGR
jgi:hypothetical protein